MANIKTWEVFLVGVLAEEEYVEQETGHRRNAFVNKQNVVQFSIKVISQEPDNFPNERLFTCFASDLEQYGFSDELFNSDTQRIENLIEFMQDFLVVFTPAKKVISFSDAVEVYQAKDIQIIKKAASYKNNDTLIPLPIFSEKKYKYDFIEFKKRISTKKFLGKTEKISLEANDTPQYVLWEETDGVFSVIGDFESHNYAHGGLSLLFNEEIKINKFPNSWIDDTYEVNESILFLKVDMFEQLGNLLKKDDAETLSTQSNLTEMPLPMNKKDLSSKEEALIKTIKPIGSDVLEDQTESPEDVIKEEEIKFIEHFVHVTHENGLQYDEKDLINFHVAMKTSNLVIIQGMSGTGKSRLVTAYAKALNIHNDQQLTVIPVRPSWSDDADLIGYVDSMHMIYRPGDSGLIDTLKNASNERNKLFIIAFDEMNLARVEHYFSQFLSVLEMEPGKRVLRLYNDSLENRLYNSAQYSPTIPIGDNVLFVGTVNIDETTYHFSDKVLDRSNLLTLNILPYELLKELKEEKKRKIDTGEVKKYSQLFPSFKNTEQNLQLSNSETKLLWDLHIEMQKITSTLGIGPRVVRQIDAYLKNLVKSPFLSRETAFDLLVVQRILTKLRGPEEYLKNLIGKYNLETGELTDSIFLNTLNKYKEEKISEFEETEKVLKHKAKELKINGYTY